MRTGLAAGTIVSGALGATLGAVAAGFGGLAFIASYATALWIIDEGPKRRPVTSLRLGGRLLHLKQDHAEATRVFQDGGPGQFGLALHHTEGVELLRGPEVKRVLSHVVPTLSPFGGAKEEITSAIELVDSAGSADDCVAQTMQRATRYGGWFSQFPVETRLALEMSLQEEGERRALEGELEMLEREWREAEQIAAIADSLLMPGDVLERIAGLRRGVQKPGFAFS